MSNNTGTWVGSIATVVAAGVAVLTFYYQYRDKEEQPVIEQKPDISAEAHETNSECKTLPLKLSVPIEIEKGYCFSNDSNTHKSSIRLVTRNAIIFLNYKGKEITCSMGDTCSFGWPGAPKFHVVSNGYPEENAYIVGAN